MLNQVLHEIELSQNGLNLNELSRKLDIDRSALDGMIQFWVQKGRLIDDASAESTTCATETSCGASCSGESACPFVMEMPKSYSLSNLQERNNDKI